MKQPIVPIVFLCLLLILAACSNNDKKSAGTTPPQPPAATTPAVAPPRAPVSDTLYDWIGAFYKMDDKSSLEQDTAIINNWWKQKLVQVDLYGRPANIFQQHGGGPNGAEWNPLTDLFLVVTSRQVWNKETVTLYLNGIPVPGIKFTRKIPATKTGSLYYAQLPEKIWSSNLRPLTREDLIFKQGKQWADSAIKAGINMNAAEALRIEVRITSPGSRPLKLESLYEAAFGE